LKETLESPPEVASEGVMDKSAKKSWLGRLTGKG